jgi:hypothetical protein
MSTHPGFITYVTLGGTLGETRTPIQWTLRADGVRSGKAELTLAEKVTMPPADRKYAGYAVLDTDDTVLWIVLANHNLMPGDSITIVP